MGDDHDEGYEMHDFYEHDSIRVTNAKGEHARIRLPERCEDAWAYIAEAFPKAYDMFDQFDPVTKGERIPTIDDDDELCGFFGGLEG